MPAADILKQTLAAAKHNRHSVLVHGLAETIWVDVLAYARTDYELHQQLDDCRTKATGLPVEKRPVAFRAFAEACARGLFEIAGSGYTEFEELFTPNTLDAIARHIALES